MTDEAKRAAGRAAAERIEDGMRLGLGTGSTIAYFLEALAERGADVAGIPTSEQTAERCRALGIPLLDPESTEELDLAVDGADELDRQLNLTKGGGGALLREKVVASLARELIVVATPDKVVDRLGRSFPLPVEVIPFALGPVTRRLEALGFHVEPRGGGEYRTDNHNAILDATMADGIDDPAVFEAQINLIPGVAENGLFVDLATVALLGSPDGTVDVLEPDEAP